VPAAEIVYLHISPSPLWYNSHVLEILSVSVCVCACVYECVVSKPTNDDDECAQYMFCMLGGILTRI